MSTPYDIHLTEALPHLDNHSCYLPHIGQNYNIAAIKVMIIAESHYLPQYLDNKFTVDDWYDNPELIYKTLKNEDKGWIDTRGVIKHYRKAQKTGGMVLFSNLERAYAEVFSDKKLFEDCVFLNYFQRPAEAQGESILVSKRDSEVAFQNLITLIDVVKPNKVIFVSSKAFKDFQETFIIKKLSKKGMPYIGSVPHAGASMWWNKASKKFALKGEEPVTGKQKFIRLITPKSSIGF